MRVTKESSKVIHKKPLQIIKKKWISILIIKWAKDINRHFTKEDKQMANKHMERCSVPLLVKYKLRLQCNIPYQCQNG